jgi:hypothetical protein
MTELPDNLSTRLKTTTDHRPCFARKHASNENRLVATLFMSTKKKRKKKTDAHDELDGNCYKIYFAEKLLPSLPPKCVNCYQ